MSWGVIVLAAGCSSRMGRPKMTLPWGGSTVLARVLETLAIAMGGRPASAIVVTGGDGEAVGAEVARLEAARRLGAACVANPDYRNGEMMDSLAAGLRSLPPGTGRALIALGDQPQLSAAAAAAVIEAAERSDAPIVAPVHGGRRGHPWAVSAGLWPELAAAHTARAFLGSREGLIEECPADATVLKDLDSPEDYERERPRA